LHYLDKEYPEAIALFQILKTEHGYAGLKRHIEQAVEKGQ
ncbi:MAG: tRNA dihydrouridine(16) synthase DusC, partial [Actinobacillus minor]|nr:tRNA dihydrouridine(16) synthase DusC [Actinobacillus minor]